MMKRSVCSVTSSKQRVRVPPSLLCLGHLNMRDPRRSSHPRLHPAMVSSMSPASRLLRSTARPRSSRWALSIRWLRDPLVSPFPLPLIRASNNSRTSSPTRKPSRTAWRHSRRRAPLRLALTGEVLGALPTLSVLLHLRSTPRCLTLALRRRRSATPRRITVGSAVHELLPQTMRSGSWTRTPSPRITRRSATIGMQFSTLVFSACSTWTWFTHCLTKVLSAA